MFSRHRRTQLSHRRDVQTTLVGRLRYILIGQLLLPVAVLHLTVHPNLRSVFT